MQLVAESEFILYWDCMQLIFVISIKFAFNILEVQCIQLILIQILYFFLIDSVEDGEKLVKTALEAFGRIGTVASLLYLCYKCRAIKNRAINNKYMKHSVATVELTNPSCI